MIRVHGSANVRLGVRMVVALVLLVGARGARAEQVGALEARWDWRLLAVRVEGDREVSEADIREVMLTKARPWYAPWRDLPEFDPATFEGDVGRVQALYRTRGFYAASAGYDLELDADGEHLTAVIYVDEGPLVRVEDVRVSVAGGVPAADQATLARLVPLRRDDPFVEVRYREGEARIEAWFRERAHARVRVDRHARVDVAAERAAVRYDVTPGPACVFGDVTIAGNVAVETEVIRREIVITPGAPYRQSLIERTRANLVALGVFSSVRVTPRESPEDPVGVELEVAEGPPRSVRFGIGYDSEEQVRGLASWRHYNFLGGARQVGIAARYSLIQRSIVADFVQPHFPAQDTRLRLIAMYQREDEDPFLVDRTRGMIRGEWEPVTGLVGYLSYRAENASLSEVPLAVARAIPDAIPKNAILSSIAIGIDWSRTDDPLDPGRGVVLRSVVEPVGGPLGGNVDFVRLFAEGRAYVPLWERTFAALRLRMGTADSFGGTEDVPIYERFFSGGTDSVRGYERWHIGPLPGGDPTGGRSLVEVSAELRYRLTEALALDVFLDGGQVDRKSWRLPFGDLQLGTGIGARYRTPIGPIRVDLGFPLDRPRGDAGWQVHFTVGQSF